MSDVDRWRLVLGRYASGRLPGEAGEPGGERGGEQERMEVALDYLYRREYGRRGVRPEGDDVDDEDTGAEAGAGAGRPEPGPGGLGGSQPGLVSWLGEIRELFPRDTCEVIEKHALDRYGLTALVTDPDTLERLEPNEDLLRILLTLKGHLGDEVALVARRIIRQVVEELRRRLELDVRPALSGRLTQHRHSPIPVAANFDPRDTIRRNLAHYDLERGQLVLQEVRFFERNTRRLPWDIVICVDQSGSMVGSVIHSAVMAGILAGLPAYRVRLVVFDTSVVDLTSQVDDPVDVLLSVQLGGGTDIGRAVRYCAQLVDNPARTVIVLVTDFCEGASPDELVRAVAGLAETRVRMLGLAALDGQAAPFYDRAMAGRLADVGMEIAALTPAQLAEWLVEVTA